VPSILIRQILCVASGEAASELVVTGLNGDADGSFMRDAQGNRQNPIPQALRDIGIQPIPAAALKQDSQKSGLVVFFA